MSVHVALDRGSATRESVRAADGVAIEALSFWSHFSHSVLFYRSLFCCPCLCLEIGLLVNFTPQCTLCCACAVEVLLWVNVLASHFPLSIDCVNNLAALIDP